MYWCFNAVTGHAGSGTAVLVRALEPLDGTALMRKRRRRAVSDVQLTNGPGKLCAALDIGPEQSGLWLQRPPVTIRAGIELSDSDVLVSPRIGISKATSARHRYFVRDNPFVSRAPAHFRIARYSPAEG
jgi:DNA-3-methyladenine glycosylase